MNADECDIVGLAEVAERLDVKPRTMNQWRYRSLAGEMTDPMPEPVGVVSGSPAFDWLEMVEWAIRTGRYTPPKRKRAKAKA